MTKVLKMSLKYNIIFPLLVLVSIPVLVSVRIIDGTEAFFAVLILSVMFIILAYSGVLNRLGRRLRQMSEKM